MNTIKRTLNANLCAGCGTCAGVCPNSAIKMAERNGTLIPVFVESKCVSCGLCLRVCPGYSVDFDKLSSLLFNCQPYDSVVGHYSGFYLGHSNDSEIQYNSSSGGLVTELLIYALDEGLIDGAVVTRMNAVNPLRPEVFIARTKKEIVEASGSKYCPVPVNVVIKRLLKENGKYAVVGLPCHIQGLRKAEQLNSELASKIVLHIGLFCNHTPTFYATDYLLNKLKVDKKDVLKLSYRGDGWPGKMSILLRDERKKEISQFNPFYWGYKFQVYFFTKRCLLCNDKECRLSDISFADAWGLSSSIMGESAVITRTNVGEELLLKLIDNGKVSLKKLSRDQIVFSQSLHQSKMNFYARVKIFKILGRSVPLFNQQKYEPSFADYLGALVSCLRLLISSKQELKGLIYLPPQFVWKTKNSEIR